MNNIVYQEKFISWPIISFILVLDFLTLIALQASVTSLVLVFISFIVLLNIFSLKIEVEGNTIFATFGIGFLSTSLPANQIEAFGIQDLNSLLAWAYNPKGTQSLVIKLRDNKVHRLPSREPKKIINYLQSKI